MWEPAERGLMQHSNPPRWATGDRFVLRLKELRGELATCYCKGTSMDRWADNRCSQGIAHDAQGRERRPGLRTHSHLWILEFVCRSVASGSVLGLEDSAPASLPCV